VIIESSCVSVCLFLCLGVYVYVCVSMSMCVCVSMSMSVLSVFGVMFGVMCGVPSCTRRKVLHQA